MTRTLTIAATAALLLAAPSYAEQAIHISTAGKSAQQLKLEVKRAAETLCFQETRGMVGYLAAFKTCVDASMADALAQARDPALKLASK